MRRLTTTPISLHGEATPTQADMGRIGREIVFTMRVKGVKRLPEIIQGVFVRMDMVNRQHRPCQPSTQGPLCAMTTMKLTSSWLRLAPRRSRTSSSFHHDHTSSSCSPVFFLHHMLSVGFLRYALNFATLPCSDLPPMYRICEQYLSRVSQNLRSEQEALFSRMHGPETPMRATKIFGLLIPAICGPPSWLRTPKEPAVIHTSRHGLL